MRSSHPRSLSLLEISSALDMVVGSPVSRETLSSLLDSLSESDFQRLSDTAKAISSGRLSARRSVVFHSICLAIEWAPLLSLSPFCFEGQDILRLFSKFRANPNRVSCLARAFSGDQDALREATAWLATPEPTYSAPVSEAPPLDSRESFVDVELSGSGASPVGLRSARQSLRADSSPPRRSHHVYGSKGSLAFEVDEARRHLAHRTRTIRIEAAPSTSGTTHWSRKIAFQLDLTELPLFAAVVLGFRPSAEFSFHGEARDKALSVRAQQGGLVVSVSRAKSLRVTVPVIEANVFYLSELVLYALTANTFSQDPSLALSLLERSFPPIASTSTP